MAAKKPKQLRIRAYNVGFGDCFLLTFVYGTDDTRNVLIDFGTTRVPDGAGPGYELAIANEIRKDCGDRGLDVVVATHRHRDHISGFATKKKPGDPDASGDVIRDLAKNAIVILPWTEDPDAPTDATDVHHLSDKGSDKKAFVQQLEGMHAFADAVVRELDAKRDQAFDADTVDPTELAASSGPKQRMHREDGDDAESSWFSEKTLRKRLAFIGEDAIKNVSAVTNLITMGKERRYVHFEADAGLKKVLPGVDVDVLGPPTIEQWSGVKKQKSKDKDEYWHLQSHFWNRLALNTGVSAAASSARADRLFPNAKICEPSGDCKHPDRCGDIPRASEWFVRRLRGVRAKQLMQLVLSMDSAMNNTSVILLIKAGKKKLLFPGDAQIENWEWALKHAPNHEAILEELADVDVYKVGHHGSLNATPKTLWNNFKKVSDDPNDKKRMKTLISTKKGVHAHSPQTAVPRTTLVAALKKNTNYTTTEGVKPEDRSVEEVINL